MFCYYCMKETASAEGICPECGKEIVTAADPEYLQPGTVLCDRYTVGNVLGAGGFGVTYAGKDQKLDIRIAIKEYYPKKFAFRGTKENPDEVILTDQKENKSREVLQNSEHLFEDEKKKQTLEKGMRRFLSEARTLAKFNSEAHIVHASDYFEINGTAYIVMEYVEGETLLKYLKKKENSRLSPGEAVALFKPILEVLSRVHEAGLIHRDISPDNFIVKNGSLTLIDFGSAQKIIDEETRLLTRKDGYSPLEQANPDSVQGSWMDIYAVCATLYRCITGRRPPDANTRVYEDTLQKPSELGIPIPAHIENAIMQGLQVNYKQRTQNVRTLLAELSGIEPEEDDDPVTVVMDDPDTVLMNQEEAGGLSGLAAAAAQQKAAPKKEAEPVQEGQAGKEKRLHPVIPAVIAVCAAGAVGLGIWHFAGQAKDAGNADALSSMISEESADAAPAVILTDASGTDESTGIPEEAALTQEPGEPAEESKNPDSAGRADKEKPAEASAAEGESSRSDDAPAQQQGQSGRERPARQQSAAENRESETPQQPAQQEKEKEDPKPAEVQSDYLYADYGSGCMITGMKTNMNRLDIPERIGGKQVLAIGDNAFSGNGGIEAVSMPDSIEHIGASAFENCTALSEVRFSQNLRTIGNYAFCNTGLYEISLPESLRELCEGAFYSNSGFEQIKIPYGVETIGDYAFGQCDMLEQVYIPVTVNHIGINGFKCDPPTPHHVEYGGSSAEWELKDFSRSAFELDWNDPDIYYNVAQEWAFT